MNDIGPFRMPDNPCPEGVQLNEREPYGLQWVYFNEDYCELRQRSYLVGEVRKAPGPIWKIVMRRGRILTAQTMKGLFRKIVEFYDSRWARPSTVCLETYNVSFPRSIKNMPLDLCYEESGVHRAAVLLGMEARMLPSKRYGSKHML